MPSSGKALYLKASKLGEALEKKYGMGEKGHGGTEEAWRDEVAKGRCAPCHLCFSPHKT